MQLILCMCKKYGTPPKKIVQLIHHACKKYATKTIKQNWKLWTSNKNHMIILVNA